MSTLSQRKIRVTAIDEGGTLNAYINPNCTRTYVTLLHNTGTSGPNDVAFIINTSHSTLGDELIIAVSYDFDAGQHPNLFFNTENHIRMASCGSFIGDGGEGAYISPEPRWVSHFWFDGTNYINNYDNC